MNEEERLKLAAKLDNDLDDFINSLERKPYTDGWSPETWQKEMESHPFFMKKVPEPGDDVHPLYEGLQQLKFDTELNSPEDLAEKYKEDGNYWMKHKKYRIAILSYTEGLSQRKSITNHDLLANLYNNRSAANFFLQNYRSSYLDAKEAIFLKKDYDKAKIRMLKCNMELKKYDEVCKDVEEFLQQDPTNKDLINMQKEAIIKKTARLRDERKSQMDVKKKRQEFQALVQALIQRNIKFDGLDLKSLQTIDSLKPTIEPLENTPVSIDKHGTIYWPLVFCYPEYSITDIQQQIPENETIFECLEDLFSIDEGDKPHSYTNPNDMCVYFATKTNQFVKINLNSRLKDIVTHDRFTVCNGYITMYVVPKGSNAENEFLSQMSGS